MLYSDLIATFLAEKKITHVFDLTGGMIAFLEDAISKKEGIECVPMHHEQAAGFAAEGYARKSGNFGVAMGTSGPGATNLITAIGSCYFDSVPALFITGQVNSANLKKSVNVRQEGFQETDVVSLVKGITKYSVLVNDPKRVIYELEKAAYIMKQGRPGAVLVDIPINILRTPVEEGEPLKFIGSEEHKQLESVQETDFSKELDNLNKLLNEANAPLVLVGHGVRISNTQNDLLDFIERTNIPVVSSLLGLDTYPYGPNFVGYIGSNGNRDANITLANADLIIVLGSRLDLRQTGDPKTFNQGAKIVQVDVDANAINYAIPTDVSFNADLKTFFSLTKDLKLDRREKWWEFVAEVKKNFSRQEIELKGVNPNTFIKTLSNAVGGNTTVVVDVGQNQQWCAQSWVTKEGQRLLFAGGMGAMGFALPAAIGAWYADQNSQLIVISGDGGLQINIQELETVARNNVPMKLFVFNNKSLGMVREFQDTYLNKNYESTVEKYGNPDFKKLADAYGLAYESIASDKCDDLVSKILKFTGPVLVEVDINIETPLHPKVVFGHALDDQFPYMDDEKKELLQSLKDRLLTA